MSVAKKAEGVASFTYAIQDILRTARSRGVLEPVSVHLVGAHLTNRFPGVKIDEALALSGNPMVPTRGRFHVGDAAIFVDVEPTTAHLQRCGASFEAGFKPIQLAPSWELDGLRRQSQQTPHHDFIQLASIEDFIGISLDWMSGFSQDGRAEVIRGLAEAFNARIQGSKACHDLNLRASLTDWSNHPS